MANILILNQNQIFNGLGTLTYTVPTTGNYNVEVQSTFPQAYAVDAGAGSGVGLGSGAGGGDTYGFTRGGVSGATGGVGQGFGPVATVYPQPPAYGSNDTPGAAISSGVSIVVNQNGSPIYTSPTLGIAQSAVQFKKSFQATATDTITVVLSSTVASDKGLNGVMTNVSIGQGF